MDQNDQNKPQDGTQTPTVTPVSDTQTPPMGDTPQAPVSTPDSPVEEPTAPQPETSGTGMDQGSAEMPAEPVSEEEENTDTGGSVA